MQSAVKLRLKVVPGASRTAVAGWLGDSLKTRVAQKAEKGRANQAVIELLAGVLGVASRDLEITAGATSPQKVVTIAGLPADEVQARLESVAGRR